MRALLIILFVFLLRGAMAQGPEGYDAFSNLSNSNLSMFRSFDNRYKGIHGFPTLFENFVMGNVTLRKNNQEYKNMELNFDLVAGEVLFQSPKFQNPFVIASKEILSFTLIDPEGEDLIFRSLEVDGKIIFGEALFEGTNISLYCQHIKVIEKANYGGAYNLNDKRYDEFVESKKYFIRQTSGVTGITLKKKEIQERFPSVGISEYFKSKKPDLKESQDVADLFNFIDRQLSKN